MKRRSIVHWKGLADNLMSHAPWSSVPDELKGVVEGLVSGSPLNRLSALLQKEGTFEPVIDVEETDQAIIVRAELAGMKEDDVEILLNGDLLTIRGEKTVERKEEGYYESRRGAFRRDIPLSVEIRADKVGAAMSNGVLTVTVPKASPGKGPGKKIEIRSAGS